MSTFVAIVAGTAAGGYLFDVWRDSLWLIGALTLMLAIFGTIASLRIRRVPAAAPHQTFDWNPFGEITDGLVRLWRDRVLWPTVVGLSYFWFLGALLQLVVILFGTHVMGLDDRWVGILTTFAAVGHWRRQHGGRQAVGRQGRTWPGADRRVRHGHLLDRARRVGRLVPARGHQPHPDRLLRRPVCGAAERHAAAASRRGGAGAADCHQQLPQCGRDSDLRPGCSGLPATS